MDVFDNCRICLREINHEPIKMTRIISKFLKSLQMTNITKPNSPTNVKQNLCAVCFNKLSELQDFHELCKDADEFWLNVFENEKKPNNVLESDTDLIDAAGNCNSTDNALTEPSSIKTAEQYEENDQVESEQTIILPTPPTQDLYEEEEVEPQIKHFDMDLTDWPDESNDRINDIHDIEKQHHEIDAKEQSNEIIEYEYKLDLGDAEIEEIPAINDATVESVSEAGYGLNTYEAIDVESSNEGTIIQKSLDDILEEPQNDGDSSFTLQTSMDDGGKMKMGYKCEHCDKIFSRHYDIESHYNIHFNVKPYICSVCGKAFRQKNILTTHEALHFGKKVECKECGKKFARKSQLILHHRMHRDEKPFQCEFENCNAAFRQRQHLIDHSFIHTGVKNFECSTCLKSFHTRKRLQDHIYKVHSQHRYRCDMCERAFLKPHMLKNHMIAAHNVKMNDVSHLKTTIGEKKKTKKN